MGTDLTMLVEMKRHGEWQPLLLPIWPNVAYDPESDDVFQQRRLLPVPTVPRNYALYSLLADVRNKTGRGTAQMQTIEVPDMEPIEILYDTDDGGHDPITPIDNPRGCPPDATDVWKELAESGAYHDLTYLSVRELIDAPWDQMVYEQGVTSEVEYLQWQKDGERPQFVARGAGGPGVLVVNELEYAAGIRGERSTSVNFRFRSGTVRELSPAFLAVVGALKGFCDDEDYSTVRLMLAFDS